MMFYLFKGLFYLAILYLLWGGLMVFLSIINPVYIINKKYLCFVLSGISGAVMGIISYINDYYGLALVVLVLPFLTVKIFGGELDLRR